MYGKQLLGNTFASPNNQGHLTAIFFEGLILKAGVKRTIGKNEMGRIVVLSEYVIQNRYQNISKFLHSHDK
jgi:hypothetical protein